MIQRYEDRLPPESHDELLAQLTRLKGQLPITVSAVFAQHASARSARLVIRPQLLPDATLEPELFVRAAPVRRHKRPAAEPRGVMFLDGGSRAGPASCAPRATARDRYRALVFIQFASHLALIREALDQTAIPAL